MQVVWIRNVSLFLRILRRLPSCLTSTSSPTRSLWSFGATAVTIHSPDRNFTRGLWASWGSVVSVPTLVTFALFQVLGTFPNCCLQISSQENCGEGTELWEKTHSGRLQTLSCAEAIATKHIATTAPNPCVCTPPPTTATANECLLEKARHALFQHQHTILDAGCLGFLLQQLQRLVHGFVREFEGSVVHGDHPAGFQIEKGAGGVGGIGVDVAEGRRVVGSDGQ